MKNRLLRLYPEPFRQVPLNGVYLAHELHTLGSAERPFVYANFLSSLDGRIAVEDVERGNSYIPKHITTETDFRLFMELHAQADCLITHGGYLRALSEGRLGNILQVGVRPENRDLTDWRKDHGLQAQPTIVVASASLDFPLHDSLREFGQAVYIATGSKADPERVRYWQGQGCQVVFAGEQKLVRGGPLVRELGLLGFRRIYLIAGPQMLDTMVRERQLSRLYHTITHQLVGGTDFHTLLPGPMLGPEGNLRLRELYYDPDFPEGSGQFFAQFEPNAC